MRSINKSALTELCGGSIYLSSQVVLLQPLTFHNKVRTVKVGRTSLLMLLDVKLWSLPVCKLKEACGRSAQTGVYSSLWTYIASRALLCFPSSGNTYPLEQRAPPVPASQSISWQMKVSFILKVASRFCFEIAPPLPFWVVFHFAANLKFLADTSLRGVHKQSVTRTSCLRLVTTPALLEHNGSGIKSSGGFVCLFSPSKCKPHFALAEVLLDGWTVSETPSPSSIIQQFLLTKWRSNRPCVRRRWGQKDLNWSLKRSLFILYTTYSGTVQIYSSVRHNRCLQGKIAWQADTISRIIASCLSLRQQGFIFLLTGYLQVLRSLKKESVSFRKGMKKSLFSFTKVFSIFSCL